MKRMTYAMMPVLVLALTASAFAAGKAVTTVEDHKDTLQVTLSGKVDLDYIHRSDELVDLIFGEESEAGTVEGEVVVSLNAELSNNVQVIVDLRAYRAWDGRTRRYGEENEESDLFVERACVSVSEFLDPAIGLELGVIDPVFQVSNIGGAIFNPRKSASITTGINDGASVQLGVGELQPTGLAMSYQRDKLGLTLLALPAIVENGVANDRDTEAAWGAMFTYDMAGSIGACGEGSQIAGMAVLHNAADTTGSDASGKESAFWTVGGGINLVGVTENLDVFGELYAQFGDVYEDTATDDMIEAGGMAFQAGARLNLEGENKPYVCGIITYLSGDDDSTDTDEDGFLSYESIDDLMIVEDQYFGLNVRNNYMALKGKAGLTTKMGENEVELNGVIGFVQAAEDVVSGADEEDAMGIEVDAMVVYHLNGQASIVGGVAFLTSSDVLEITTGNEEDSTWLFTIGVNGSY